MITITKLDDNIHVVGHANYAPCGKDIVCAGVSTLVQNLIQSIEMLTSDTIKYDMKPGEVHINFEKSLSKQALILIDSFYIGVQAIAREYPNYVKIEENVKLW